MTPHSMELMRIRNLVLVLLVLVSTLVFAAGEQRVLLRRKLIRNDSVKYKMVSNIKSDFTLPDGSSGPESVVDITGDYTITTGDTIKGGKIPVEVKTSNMKMTSTQAESDMGSPNLDMHGWVDERGTMSDIVVDSSDEQTKHMGALFGNIVNGISGFPEHGVQPGDTWTITMPMSALGMKDIQLDVKYEGERTQDGQTFWVLQADQDVPLEADLSSMAQASGEPADSTPHMVLKGTMHVTFEGLYDMDGRTYSLKTENRSDLSVDGPQGGQVHIHSDQTSTMTREN